MQEEQMKNRDKRTRLMSELLANIKRYGMQSDSTVFLTIPRSIKLYAWDYSFARKVLHTRNERELRMLKKIGLVTVCANAISMVELYLIYLPGSELDFMDWNSTSRRV